MEPYRILTKTFGFMKVCWKPLFYIRNECIQTINTFILFKENTNKIYWGIFRFTFHLVLISVLFKYISICSLSNGVGESEGMKVVLCCHKEDNHCRYDRYLSYCFSLLLWWTSQELKVSLSADNWMTDESRLPLYNFSIIKQFKTLIVNSVQTVFLNATALTSCPLVSF